MRNHSKHFTLFLKQFILLFFLLSSLPYATADTKKINVVVTIKPLEALVLAIAKDTVNIQRLLPDYASLHDYHFRPSDIKKIKHAHVVFRIDEAMERFLSPLFQNLNQTPLISLADIPNIHLLPLQTSAETPAQPVQAQGHHHQHNIDFHIWMSPKNGIVMAKKIMQVLSELNPHYQAQYEKNFNKLQYDINQFTQKFSSESNVFKNRAYLVFHDSWGHFSQAFHLHKLATINLHSELQIGARTLYNTRQYLKKSKATCLFTEANFRPRMVKTLVEGFDIKIENIDPLASHLKPSPHLYLDLLRDTAQHIKHCLSYKPSRSSQ
ncbi:MAG: zinc ABC transporter substrate-binding protein [Cocleimonas sp.]|nr:zinc ABC transporter substrate-binding protein [Cocleimonas sp.]